MFERGFAPGVSNNQVANVWQEFGRGNFAFYISGPWNIGEFSRRLPAELQTSWSTAPLPGPDGAGRRVDRRRLEPGAVPRSRVKPQAWALIELPVAARGAAATSTG